MCQGVFTGEKEENLSLLDDTSMSNSVCFIPLDESDRWGLPHRTEPCELEGLGNHIRSAYSAFSLIINLILSECPHCDKHHPSGAASRLNQTRQLHHWLLEKSQNFKTS